MQYTMSETQRLLGWDGKTLRLWMRRANVTPHEDRFADGAKDRRKFLTADEVDAIRATRAAYTDPRMPDVSIEDRLAALERRVAALEQSARVEIPIMPARHSERHVSHTQAASDALPDGLIGWRAFARAHEIPETTVQKAIEDGRLQIVEGAWKVGTVVVRAALDANGQSRFYQLWHYAEKFSACESCPHDQTDCELPDVT